MNVVNICDFFYLISNSIVELSLLLIYLCFIGYNCFVYLLFQGRLFSYADTHRHRLGTNYLQLPVNCPFNTRVNNYQRDGPQNLNMNQGQL